MFDFLKGGKATVKIDLDHSNHVYCPGDTVQAKVTVIGEKDLKIQQGRVALAYHEEYQYREEDWERDSDGRQHKEVHTRWGKDEREVGRQIFFNETTIKGGSTQSFDFSFPIPPDAPPSVGNARILKINWSVKVTLDRKLAGDIEQKAEVYIPAVPPGKSTQSGNFGFSNEPGEAELQLTLPSMEFLLGETIQGQFIVKPLKAFDVTEIRVDLQRHESVPRALGNTADEKTSIKLAPGTKVEAGQQQVYPFTLTLPTAAPVTCRTPNGSIAWKLSGILSRRMRTDTSVTIDIVVSNMKG